MATSDMPAGGSPDNPTEDIIANLTRLTELRLAVAEDPVLGVVAIEIQGLPDGCSCLLAPNHALDLSLRLTAACGRLMKAHLGEDLGPPDLGPGSLSSRF